MLVLDLNCRQPFSPVLYTWTRTLCSILMTLASAILDHLSFLFSFKFSYLWCPVRAHIRSAHNFDLVEDEFPFFLEDLFAGGSSRSMSMF
jgi:hypothetical protein